MPGPAPLVSRPGLSTVVGPTSRTISFTRRTFVFFEPAPFRCFGSTFFASFIIC